MSKCQKIVVGKDYLVAKGKWAVPADNWRDFDYQYGPKPKKKKKSDGGWGRVREDWSMGTGKFAGRDEAYVGELSVEKDEEGLIRPRGYGDFTQDVFW